MCRWQRKSAEELNERLQDCELIARERGVLEVWTGSMTACRARGNELREQLGKLLGSGFNQPRLKKNEGMRRARRGTGGIET